MGIFDRIRTIFSRSSSSSTNGGRLRHDRTSHQNKNETANEFINVVQHSYQVEQNCHFNASNIHTSSQSSANVRDKSSAGALQHTSTASCTTRGSNMQDLKHNADFEKANSNEALKYHEEVTLRNTIYSADWVKASSHTVTNVSQLPRSTQSQANVKDESNQNDYKRVSWRPNESKAISAEHNTTDGNCASKNKANSCILQNTLNPEYRKQTAAERNVKPATKLQGSSETFSSFESLGNVMTVRRLQSSSETVPISTKIPVNVKTATKQQDSSETVSGTKIPVKTATNIQGSSESASTVLKNRQGRDSLSNTLEQERTVKKNNSVHTPSFYQSSTGPFSKPTTPILDHLDHYQPTILQQDSIISKKNNTTETPNWEKRELFSINSAHSKTLRRAEPKEASVKIEKSCIQFPSLQYLKPSSIENAELSYYGRAVNESHNNLKENTTITKNSKRLSGVNNKTSVPISSSYSKETPKVADVCSISLPGTIFSQDSATRLTHSSSVSKTTFTTSYKQHKPAIVENVSEVRVKSRLPIEPRTSEISNKLSLNNDKHNSLDQLHINRVDVATVTKHPRSDYQVVKGEFTKYHICIMYC